MISRKTLIDILKKSGRYEDTDEPLINELYFNLGVMKQAKEALKESKSGILSAGDKDGKIWHPHPALKIYDQALRHVLTISIRLGLSERDRRQMGIDGKIEDDEVWDDI